MSEFSGTENEPAADEGNSSNEKMGGSGEMINFESPTSVVYCPTCTM
jgi:hypothetical protein